MFLIQSTLNMEASSRFLNQSLIERHIDSLNKVEGPANKDDLFESITHNLKKNKATVVSHYYVDPLIQEITENIVKQIPTLIEKKIDLFSSKVNQNLNGI